MAEKVATRPSGRKTKGGAKGKSSAADRREERRLAREAKRAGRAAAREERKARWAARTEWLRDPRVKQVIGVLALSSGAFMVLAGVSAWIEYHRKFWESALDRLERALDLGRTEPTPPPKPKGTRSWQNWNSSDD